MLRRRLSIRIGSLASYAPVRRLRRRTHSPYQSTSPTTVLRASPPSLDASKTRQACLAEVTRCFTRVFLWNAPLNSRGNGDVFVRSEPCNRTTRDPGWQKNSSTSDCSEASAHATSRRECCKLPTLAGQSCPAAAHGLRAASAAQRRSSRARGPDAGPGEAEVGCSRRCAVASA